MGHFGKIILAAFAVHLALPSEADAADYLRHHLNGQSLTVESNETTVTITAHGDEAIEVVYDRPGLKQLPSFAIAGAPPAVNVRVEDRGDELLFRTPVMTATIRKHPLNIAFSRLGAPLVAEEQGFFADEAKRGFRFALRPGEKLMGGGQRVLGMDRRGQLLPLDNHAAYGYAGRTDAMYYGIPAVISDRKYLLLFDNSARGEMDLGKTEPDVLRFQAGGGRTAYVVVGGAHYADIVRHYVTLTGRQPLPPRWAFGSVASRFGYHSGDEARAVVRRYREDDLPLDAIVFDVFWFGPEVKGHMGTLAWDRRAFPEPERMIADFNADGVKTILITEPFILNSSSRWQEAIDHQALGRDASGAPKVFDFYFGTGGLVDMFSDKAVDWFWGTNKALLDQGVAGIWGDLGEPEVHPADMIHAGGLTADEIHNAYGHEWAAQIDRRWRKAFPGQRPFLMMRSGFAGSQRYGVIPWSGDVARAWPALQAQIEIALQMSVLGLAYSHSDLGGFVALDSSSKDPNAVVPFDRELYIRWLQYGAFQPVFRPHSQEQIAPEPVFQDAETKDIVRRYLKQRYRLLPYLYTMAWRNSMTGAPLMQPLAFAEDDAGLFDDQSAYLWGPDLLVAPVTEKGATAKRFHLAKGIWFDLHGGARHEGGRVIEVPVTLAEIPVFVRAGAFLPMIGDIKTTRDYRSDALTLHYYHDAAVKHGAGQMYEDDGKTPDAVAKGRYELLDFAADARGGALGLTLKRTRHKAYDGQPATRRITLVVHNWTTPPHSAQVEGRAVTPVYDAGARTLTLAFDWAGADARVALR